MKRGSNIHTNTHPPEQPNKVEGNRVTFLHLYFYHDKPVWQDANRVLHFASMQSTAAVIFHRLAVLRQRFVLAAAVFVLCGFADMTLMNAKRLPSRYESTGSGKRRRDWDWRQPSCSLLQRASVGPNALFLSATQLTTLNYSLPSTPIPARQSISTWLTCQFSFTLLYKILNSVAISPFLCGATKLEVSMSDEKRRRERLFAQLRLRYVGRLRVTTLRKDVSRDTWRTACVYGASDNTA